MKLTKLLTYLTTEPSVNDSQDPEITSIEMDSREVKKGSLFVCVKGYTVDGHDFAQKAVERRSGYCGRKRARCGCACHYCPAVTACAKRFV